MDAPLLDEKKKGRRKTVVLPRPLGATSATRSPAATSADHAASNGASLRAG